LQRCKTDIINNACVSALKSLLKQVLPPRDAMAALGGDTKVDLLARGWFLDEEGSQDALSVLQRRGLDETAIIAEAIRIKSKELESIERMLTLVRSRFDRALRSVNDYKDSLARRLRQAAEQVLQTDDPPGLENASLGS
jgi:hypothetical protein